MDVTNISLPQWLSTGIAVVVLALLWRVVCAFVDQYIARNFLHRRTGSRSNDDYKSTRNDWTDRLIESMNNSAEINREVASALAILSGKQDAVLEAFKLTQMQQHESNQLIGQVLQKVERLQLASEGS